MPNYERVLSTEKLIQLQKALVLLTTAVNIIILFYSIRFPIHEEDPGKGERYPGRLFITTLPIIVNLYLFVGTLIVFIYPGECCFSVRLINVAMLCMGGLFLALFPLISISAHDGCSSGYYSNIRELCYCQLVVGCNTLVWVAMHCSEVMMSYSYEQQRQRGGYAPLE